MRGDGSEGDLVTTNMIMIIIVNMVVGDGDGDEHDCLGISPDFLFKYDSNHHRDIVSYFSDRPSCPVLRQQPWFKAGLWSCEGEGGLRSGGYCQGGLGYFDILIIVMFF